MSRYLEVVKDEWDVIHLAFFGGWVVRRKRLIWDGQPKPSEYVDFPDCTYGVLDSTHVRSHRTKGAAEKRLARLRGLETETEKRA